MWLSNRRGPRSKHFHLVALCTGVNLIDAAIHTLSATYGQFTVDRGVQYVMPIPATPVPEQVGYPKSRQASVLLFPVDMGHALELG